MTAPPTSSFSPGTATPPAAVWEGELEIFGQRISASSGAQVGSNDFQLSDMGTPGNVTVGAFRPAIAVRTLGTSEYLIAWHADQDTLGLVDDEYEIYGQRINAATGVLVGVAGSAPQRHGPGRRHRLDARSAAVAYNPAEDEYLVVWEGDDDNGTLVDGETEIFAQRVNAATGAQVGAGDFRISDMGPDGDPAYDAQKPAVAYNGVNHEYLVVWSGEENIGALVNGEFEIFGQRIDAGTGLQVGLNDFRISDMGPDGAPNFDALEPAVAFNSVGNEYLVVWEGD